MKIIRLLWIILGFTGLGIGAVDAVLPMLPAFPFLLLATFSFGKDLYIPCAILDGVWVFHIVYFLWRVKTYKPKEPSKEGE